MQPVPMRRSDLPPELNAITGQVLDAAYEVHAELGPGLLESVYRDAIGVVLAERGLEPEFEVPIPVHFRGRRLDHSLRLDLRVQGVVVELKAVEAILPVHYAQLHTYLRLTGSRVGLLINFNVTSLRHGVRRVVRKEGGHWLAFGEEDRGKQSIP